ncbi:MAG: hypothetical protein CL503_02960 [Actinobacteria bacterium]|nr:hypothetical protein [Actinomycetota bacterium]|tara:strand:+ start:353 stop:1021 length:669 start_codon:yes stop_codon:yes gene_type:complete
MPMKVPGFGGMRGMGMFRTGRTKLSRSMESLNLGEVKSYLNARISGFKKTAHLETTFQAPKFSTNSNSTKPFSKGEGAIIGSSNTEVGCVFSAVTGEDGKTTVTKYAFNDTIPNFSDDYGAGCRVTLFWNTYDTGVDGELSSDHNAVIRLLQSAFDNNSNLKSEINVCQSENIVKQDIFVQAGSGDAPQVTFIDEGSKKKSPATVVSLTPDFLSKMKEKTDG